MLGNNVYKMCYRRKQVLYVQQACKNSPSDARRRNKIGSLFGDVTGEFLVEKEGTT
ncbi:hypothetical protein GCM10007140_21690 [Priestia taiwanensis]|uniref:Uncharacterized protein n=1 Tax=Priestia taiwanensis TaxID=1347902 RepID=A0A917AUS1_9BACI|nr:hypothetical protein GCM10007140_21690 [Priestia taiwanensis]